MISDEERREVAERLRFCARETNGTGDFSMYLKHWVNADGEQEGNPFTVQANRKSAERTLEKLADLIDRPTCENGGRLGERTFLCSVCGYKAHTYSDSDCNPHDFSYCPECGAEVVE